MRILKNIASQLHIYLLWLFAAALLWGWIFTFVTDTKPERKVTVFVEAPACRDRALAVELEKTMPEGLRMIKVHPFTYAMFDESTLTGADLYIVSASQAAEYRDSFVSAAYLPLAAGRIVSEWGGIRIYDAADCTGGADDYITYAAPETAGEDYYLFFGRNSLHAAALNGTGDDAALEVAQTLLDMD